MEFAMFKTTSWFLFLVLSVEIVSAEEGCHGTGFVATSVVLSVLITLLVVGALYYWYRRRPKSEHLILETDPEKGKGEYAFDNPGFKDATLLAKSQEKSPAKNEPEKAGKQKWNSWALNTKMDKKKTLDDSSVREQETKVVTLKSHDFAGLGFNICGNMKEGIYIKDILHRGPASESGKLNPGDRINSVTINFEHIVYEDALNILSFASPYEIMVEARGGKILFGSSSKSDQPSHPIYRSTSNANLQEDLKMSKKRLFVGNSLDPSGSTLPKTLSNTTTLERKDSRSPKPNHTAASKHQSTTFSPEQLKNQLEQRITSAETEIRLRTEPIKAKAEVQKSENKHQKFGIKVFPTDLQVSPKSSETSQNDNNTNIEKHEVRVGVDEVDCEIGRRKTEEFLQPMEHFNRNDTLYGSGLKRDENGIPQEIPSHMLNAAVAARRNRKSQGEILVSEEDAKVLRKIKAKAPSPPNDRSKKSDDSLDLKEVHVEVELPVYNHQDTENSLQRTNESSINNNMKMDPDSDEETDNHSSVNTIELNSSDITIHQGENEEKQSRKTASTGDLTKIHKTRKSSNGTLERAQSLDITDSGIPTLQNKKKSKDIFDMESEEELLGKLNLEPRLSLILDGLNTFQRNRLKKSTEWGNLEDAILRANQEDENSSPDQSIPENSSFKLTEKSEELNAVVNKINEIKKEFQEIEYTEMKESNEDLEHIPQRDSVGLYKTQTKNQIWPTETETSINIQPITPIRVRPKSIEKTTIIEHENKMNIQNEIWPRELEEEKDRTPTEKNKTEVTSSIYKIETYETKTDEAYRNPISVTTNANLVDNESEKIEMDSLSPISHTVLWETSEKSEDQLTTMINGDPITEIVNSIGVDMIISETPPEAITELETMEKLNGEVKEKEITTVKVNSNVDTEEITPNKILNKIKTHKRQQIPMEENKVLPPGLNDYNHDEVIVGPNEETSIVESDAENSKFSTSASNSHVGSYLEFDRNSETGELCTALNNTDESKTFTDKPPKYLNDTESFIFNEKYLSNQDGPYSILPEDTNVSDDIKVSRHSFGSLERPKSDDAKSIESVKYSSNVTVNNVHTENGTSSTHSLELPVNDTSGEVVSESELYTTALNQSWKGEKEVSKISISTPDLIKNVTIAEAINTLNGDMDKMRFQDFQEKRKETTEDSTTGAETVDVGHQKSSLDNATGKHSSLTYITEIQVTPSSTNSNISEIEILPSKEATSQYSKSLEYARNYEILNLQAVKEPKTKTEHAKNFEIKNSDSTKGSNTVTEHTKNFEIKTADSKKESNYTSNKIDAEKELHKIQEIAQEQLKKLPEMRFSTSSYESPERNVEKRQSQVELLKSNFEKSPPKTPKNDLTKSRIPISTTMKTPPTTPEHKESGLNTDDKELFDSLSSPVHSTPMVNAPKYQKLANKKNVTVTSIRTNSRIPSGLPVVSGIRPPVPPKRQDMDDSLSSTNSSISSFKQWVFNPVNSVTNISSTGSQDNN